MERRHRRHRRAEATVARPIAIRLAAPLARALRALTVGAIAAAALGACGHTTHDTGDDADASPPLSPDCDPIAPAACGFPFPNDRWTRDDPSSATGKRVAFGATTLPAYQGARHADPAAWSDADGFSPGQAPMVVLPGATSAGLPTPDTIAASLTDASPTILLEADTLARVPHFAELDASYREDPQPTLMIRPAVRLEDATRYIVAVRRVVDASGAAIAPSAAFRALRDGTPDPSIDARRDHFADVFAKLRAAGVDARELQIAWDYTTSSQGDHVRAMLHIRDDALSKVGADGPAYTVTKIEENPNPHVRRRIHGLMTVPLYLDQPGPGGRFVRGPDGLPTQNGTAQYEFLVHVPNRVAASKTPAPIVQNGHGLLGTKEEGQDGYLAEFADAHGYVALAVDLIGFASDDVATIANAVTGDPGTFKDVVDRQQQGLLNELLAMRMMKGRFARDPSVTFEGQHVVDPTRAYYRGDSQGGIMGASYMALSTDVTRGLLGEPGLPYNLLLTRSSDFGAWSTLFRARYRTGADVQLVLAAMQMLWDRSEPDGYAPYITAPLPGTPAHDVLIHVAIGDHQVTPLGAHVLARAVGAKNVRPVNREIFGIPSADAPITGPAMVEWDFGLPPAPLANRPPTAGDDPHDKVRVLESAQAQADAFFRTGTVGRACGDSPCNAR